MTNISNITGVTLRTCATGHRYKDRDDLLVIECSEGTTVAGVFTQSSIPGFPVLWTKEKIQSGSTRAVVINAGNANVATGEVGKKTVYDMANATALSCNCDINEVLVASTGVIGEPFHADIITRHFNQIRTTDAKGAAQAIMTTDTYPKVASRTAKIGDVTINIMGIAKGSGMVAPNMATTLGFIMTDAAIASSTLQTCLDDTIKTTFNAITVDNDESTSDMVLTMATGKAGNDQDDLSDFKEALWHVLHDLCLQVVVDGEGARKLLTVEVNGAKNDETAMVVAKSIANSPLVKTAVAGEDANWGRILMAIGKTHVKVDIEKIRLWMGDSVISENTLVFEKGARAETYDEATAHKYMTGDQITFTVDLGQGAGKAIAYTCDLTKEYITINGDYRS